MSEPLKYRKDASMWFDLEPGEFCYAPDYNGGKPKWIAFWPLQSKTALQVPIRPQRGSNGASWNLTGTEEKPTLHPSVNDSDRWHGWLIDGVATP